MTPIFVWSERPELAKELVAAGRRLADTSADTDTVTVAVAVAGEIAPSELEGWARAGADRVCPLPGKLTASGEVVAALCELVGRDRPGLLLVGATKTGLEVAPRVAERAGASYAAFAVGLERDDGGSLTARCQLYAGTGLASYVFSRPLVVLTVAPSVFAPADLDGRTASLAVPVRTSATDPVSVIGIRPKAGHGEGLHEARAVVDVGRGVADLGGLESARSLAAALGGALACSRPVASERDWLPEWLGLSGAKVKPDLCLTVGVSGAVQHVIGIRDAKVIVAVNNDESAAIFAQADIGVLADAAEFLPALVERLQVRGARPAWLGTTVGEQQ